MQNLVNGLHFNNIRGDIYGGLTAAVVALPLALAMGVTSGAGPIAGMYGAIIVGFFAAIFGGTPAQVSGPTGPMTVIMALIFTQYTSLFPGDPETGAALAFTVVVLGGLFQIAFGLLRIGKFIQLVPHPVVSGFMGGIGIIIILLQIGPLMGQDTPAKPLAAVKLLPEFFTHIHHSSLYLGLIALIIVYAIPKFLPKVNKLLPSPLLALVIGTAAYMLFMKDSGTPVLGEIPTGLPSPKLPLIMMAHLPDMIQSALILAALGSIDSLLTSLVADNVTRTYHKSDRELIGQGIGNTISGIFGGLPGAGATMRTVVNVKAGGLTPISGSLHAVILLAIVLGAGSLASNIPGAVLAGILIKVGTDIIDWDYIKRIKTAPKSGIIIMLTVMLMTVFVDLMMAVAVGMIMASLLFLNRMSELQLQGITAISKPDQELPLSEKEQSILNEAKGRILLYHMEGPLSFGAAKGMIRRLAGFSGYDVLILDLTNVPMVDFTSSRALDDMIHDSRAVKHDVLLAGARPKVLAFLKKQKILQQLPDNNIHGKRHNALEHAAEILNIEYNKNKK
ncbi:MAG: SulP family inorganic anion transporter [Gammaproteobacteria bacterium]|nr:SulP family inorganic anion transporter [Gammaproteobacteria bacterium]